MTQKGSDEGAKRIECQEMEDLLNYTQVNSPGICQSIQFNGKLCILFHESLQISALRKTHDLSEIFFPKEILVVSTEAPLRFLLFLFSDWPKSNHFNNENKRGFLDTFRAIFLHRHSKNTSDK